MYSDHLLKIAPYMLVALVVVGGGIHYSNELLGTTILEDHTKLEASVGDCAVAKSSHRWVSVLIVDKNSDKENPVYKGILFNSKTNPGKEPIFYGKASGSLEGFTKYSCKDLSRLENIPSHIENILEKSSLVKLKEIIKSQQL